MSKKYHGVLSLILVVNVLVFFKYSEELVFVEKFCHSDSAFRGANRIVRSLLSEVILISTSCGMGEVAD